MKSVGAFLKRLPPSERVSWIIVALSVFFISVLIPLSLSTACPPSGLKCSTIPNSTLFTNMSITFPMIENEVLKCNSKVQIVFSQLSNDENFSSLTHIIEAALAKSLEVEIYTNIIAHWLPKGASVRYFQNSQYSFRINYILLNDSAIFMSSFSDSQNINSPGYYVMIDDCDSAISDLKGFFEMLWETPYLGYTNTQKYKWVSGKGFPKWHSRYLAFPTDPFELFPLGRPNMDSCIIDSLEDSKDNKVVITSSIYPEAFNTYQEAFASSRVSGMFEMIPFNEQTMKLAVPNSHYEKNIQPFKSMGTTMRHEMLISCNTNFQGTIISSLGSILMFPAGLSEIYHNKVATMGVYINGTNELYKAHYFWQQISSSICHVRN